MLTKTAATLVLLLALAAAVGGPATQPRPSPANGPAVITLYDGTPAPEPAESQLDVVLKEVKFDAVPLSHVLASLADLADLNLVPCWHELEAAGIEKTDPISLDLKNVTARDALSAICRSLSSQDSRPTFFAQGNLILFGADASPGPAYIIRLYDIADLIVRERDRERHLWPEPREGAGSATQYAIERIILIVSAATGNRLARTGALAGEVHEINGRLLITETPENHRRVEGVLAALRATAKVPAAPAATKPSRKDKQGEKQDQTGSLPVIPYEDMLVGNPYTFERFREEMEKHE